MAVSARIGAVFRARGHQHGGVMMRIDFSPEETDLLREILERSLNELEVEIHRANKLGFKDMLKRRKQSLEHILEKVAYTAVPA